MGKYDTWGRSCNHEHECNNESMLCFDEVERVDEEGTGRTVTCLETVEEFAEIIHDGYRLQKEILELIREIECEEIIYAEVISKLGKFEKKMQRLSNQSRRLARQVCRSCGSTFCACTCNRITNTPVSCQQAAQAIKAFSNQTQAYANQLRKLDKVAEHGYCGHGCGCGCNLSSRQIAECLYKIDTAFSKTLAEASDINHDLFLSCSCRETLNGRNGGDTNSFCDHFDSTGRNTRNTNNFCDCFDKY